MTIKLVCNSCGSHNISQIEAVKEKKKTYISARQALQLIQKYGTSQFKVSFYKTDGTKRTMKCVLPKSTFVGPFAFNSTHAAFRVMEVGVGFRSFYPDSLITLHINKKVYYIK